MFVQRTTLLSFEVADEIITFETKFSYPKLVTFENVQNVRILDLDCKSEELIETVTMSNEVILDKAIKDGLLWYIFQSGKIKVFNLLNGASIELIEERFQFSHIKINDQKLFLISESGDCFQVQYSTEKILESISANKPNILDSLKKVNTCKDWTSYVEINGLQVCIEEGTIKSQCPVTGLLENISCNAKLEHFLVWEEFSIISDNLNMWVIDIKDSNIVFEFGIKTSFCYPVGIHNNMLFYIIKDDKQIQVNCAWTSTEEASCNQDISSTFSPLFSQSQESLVNQLKLLVESILHTAELDDSVILNVQDVFEKINDFGELINLGIKLFHHNIIFKCLLYSLQKRIYNEQDTCWMSIISDLIIKIDLQEYIIFRELHNYNNINLFKLNYKDLSIMFLGNLDVDLASICWLKYSCLTLDISCDDILDILNSIPHNTKLGAIIIWLRNFVPPLVEKNPFYIETFIRWSTERVFQLEKSAYWPKIGVKFVEAILTILESSLKTISIRPISIDDLDVLKDRINYIFELKEKYKINILLSDLSTQGPSEVVLIMLRRCYTEDLDLFMQNFMLPYALRYLFNLDDILRSFIKTEAALSGGEVDGMRLKILLNAFNSPANKLDCLLQVLKVLDVPWNETVYELAITAASSAMIDFTLSNSEKNIASEIQQEINYASIKVMLMKYNLPLTCTDHTILLHNVVNASVVDLKDLSVLKSTILDNSYYVNMLYLDRCLRDGEIKLGLDFYNNLLQSDKKIILKSVIVKFDQMSNSTFSFPTVEKNYLDFIKGTKLLNELSIKDVEDLYKYKKFHDCKFSINDINIERNLVNKPISASLTQIMRTRQPSNSILLRLLLSTSTSHRVRNFVTTLISSPEENNSCNLLFFENGNNFSILLESFNVLTELATNCTEEHIHELINQLIFLNAIIKTNTVLQNLSAIWKFQYIYMSVPSNNSTNELINFYKAMFNVSNSHINSFEVNETSDFNTFRLISHITSIGLSDSSLNVYSSLRHKNTVLRKILSNIITSQNFDAALITGLLVILRTIENIDDKTWIINALRGQNDILSPIVNSYISSSTIRHTFAQDTVGNSNAGSYPPQYLLKAKCNIILSDMSLPEHAEETWNAKVVLLYVFKQYPNTSCERLRECCDVLNVSLNDGLSLQLISLLSSWNLNFKTYHDTFGSRKICIESDDKTFTNCCTIWNNIENKDFVRDILIDFWKNGEVTLHGRVLSVNAYYYEVFLCIYNLLFNTNTELKNTKEYFLLNFLQDYKRSSSPKQYEFEHFSIKGIFPEIGFFRLPFHLFMRDDMWSNLKSEITLDSYERWLPVITLLSLDSEWQTAKDMICSNAVKQTMTSRKRSETVDEVSKEHEPWRLIAKEEPLLRAAHRCVRHIANMEWAGACLFYVLQGCTRGADQVAAAHLCYQFSQRWAALQPANRAVRQMERLHATLSTRHALYKIEWVCEELLRLSTEPAQLIRALYFHPDFIKKITRFDVNRVANEIADKNAINVNSIRMQILENILEKKTREDKTKKDFSPLNNKELITAKYILKATCPKMGAIYLSRIAFDDDCSHNKCKKLCALQCLMSIVESDTAIKVTNLERDALWDSLLDLLCIVQLEMIDLPWIVMTYLQDKPRALDQLLQTVEGNQGALQVASFFALRFGNHKTVYDLINLLLRSDLHKEMIPLLLKVSTNPPNSIIYSAWRTVILSPFLKADYPISERHRSNCLNAVNLLPICPIIKDEDLKEIWKNCIRCKCLGLGCLILPYMTSQTRQTLTEFAKIDRRNLISSLKNLHSDSYLVAGAMHVVESMTLKTYR